MADTFIYLSYRCVRFEKYARSLEGVLEDVQQRGINKFLNLTTVLSIFEQLLLALKYLHEVAGYAPADIALDNMMIEYRSMVNTNRQSGWL